MKQKNVKAIIVGLCLIIFLGLAPACINAQNIEKDILGTWYCRDIQLSFMEDGNSYFRKGYDGLIDLYKIEDGYFVCGKESTFAGKNKIEKLNEYVLVFNTESGNQEIFIRSKVNLGLDKMGSSKNYFYDCLDLMKNEDLPFIYKNTADDKDKQTLYYVILGDLLVEKYFENLGDLLVASMEGIEAADNVFGAYNTIIKTENFELGKELTNKVDQSSRKVDNVEEEGSRIKKAIILCNSILGNVSNTDDILAANAQLSKGRYKYVASHFKQAGIYEYAEIYDSVYKATLDKDKIINMQELQIGTISANSLPETSDITISGNDLIVQLTVNQASKYLPKGKYKAQINADIIHPFNSTIEVVAGGNTELNKLVKYRKGNLNLKLKTKNVHILFDSTEYNLENLNNSKFIIGNYKLKVGQGISFIPEYRDITISENETTNLGLNLRRITEIRASLFLPLFFDSYFSNQYPNKMFLGGGIDFSYSISSNNCIYIKHSAFYAKMKNTADDNIRWAKHSTLINRTGLGIDFRYGRKYGIGISTGLNLGWLLTKATPKTIYIADPEPAYASQLALGAEIRVPIYLSRFIIEAGYIYYPEALNLTKNESIIDIGGASFQVGYIFKLPYNNN
ncbi:MAG: hypothetical protein PF517_04970 [Salinivirgaceae bacterium]|jgi:hypothetical protein|nr:hypothetical protein [Salinivirgaceae bacterium]